MKTLMMKIKMLTAIIAGAYVLGASAVETIVRTGWKAETTASIDNAADYLMWRNVDIRKLTNFTCYFTGASVTKDKRGYTCGYFPRWISESELEIQFQFSEGYLKCVAVRFFQNGNNVYARRNFTDYTNDANPGSRDFHASPGSNHVNSNDGYQATEIACCVQGDDGRRTILSRVKEVVVDEEITRSSAAAEFQGVIPVPGEATTRWRKEEDDPSKIVLYSCLMWRNISLKAVTNFVATTCGENIGTYQNVPGLSPHWLSDTEMVVQFQKKEGNFIKCALIKFVQYGDDVYAETYAKMHSSDAGEGVRDFFLNPSNNDGNVSGYDIKEVRADLHAFEVEMDDYAETLTIPNGGFGTAPLTWIGSGRYAEDWRVTLNVDPNSPACEEGSPNGEYELVHWNGGINVENLVLGTEFQKDGFFFTDADGVEYASDGEIPSGTVITGVWYRHVNPNGLAVAIAENGRACVICSVDFAGAEVERFTGEIIVSSTDDPAVAKRVAFEHAVADGDVEVAVDGLLPGMEYSFGAVVPQAVAWSAAVKPVIIRMPEEAGEKGVAVVESRQDATTFLATFSLVAREDEATLKICTGDVWPLTADLSDWASVIDVGPVPAGATTANVETALDALGTYVRFATVGANGTLWSPTMRVADAGGELAPEIELADVEADVASAAGRIRVASTGASLAEVYAVYGHDDFVYTNKIATAMVPGEYDFILPRLKPATSYSLYAFAENGRAGGFVQTDPVMFETAAEKLRDETIALPDGYTRLEYVESDGNQYVLPGVKPTGKTTFSITFSVPSVSLGNSQGLMGGVWNWGGTWLFQNRNGEIRFNDDRRLVTVEEDEVYTFAIKQGAAYTFTCNNAIVASGTSSIAYSQGGDIALFASNASGSYKSKMSVYAFTLWEEGEKIRDFIPCKDADGVACLYDFVSKGAFYSKTTTALIAGAEIAEYPRSVLPTESFVYDGAQLSATIARDGTLASDVYVCLGAAYGGCETNGWESVVKTGAAFGEGASSATVAVVVPEGTHYVRMFSEKDGWSETFFIAELEASDSAKVGLTDPVVVETNVVEAAFSVGLTWIGTGATAVDLYAVYGHDDFVYTNKITTTDAPGAYAFTLPNLKPETTYALYVYAENGCEDGFAQTKAIAFETAAEAFQDEIIVLPAGYTRLESVASTGGQWVDTEVVPTSKGNYSIVMDFLPVSVAGDLAYFGVAVNWNGSWLFQRHSKLGFRFDGGSDGVNVPVVVDARQRLTIDGNGALVENLDTGVAADPVTSIFRGDAIGGKSIGLFAVNGGEWATSFTLYHFKVFAAGEAVRDFVPCKDADGVACLCDLVSGKSFYSKTSTELVAGPEAEDGVAKELEVESVIYGGRRMTTKLRRDEGGEAGDVYVCYGSSYGGFGTNRWENVVKAGAFQADETLARCSFNLPKSARYMRFFSEVGGWSKTVFLPETPNRGGFAVFLVLNDDIREDVFETLEESLAEAYEAIERGYDATIAVLKETDEKVDDSSLDPSKEIVFEQEDETFVPVVQTSTEIMREVTAGGRALTANTPKLRTFLTENEVEEYTALPATAAAISAALAEVPTVEGNNGLALWKDYALGITPTTSVKAKADASKDTDPNAITISIPTIDPDKASGDFTIKYQVVDRAKRQETLTATEPDKIKIPLATGIYDVKIVFEPAT